MTVSCRISIAWTLPHRAALPCADGSRADHRLVLPARRLAEGQCHGAKLQQRHLNSASSINSRATAVGPPVPPECLDPTRYWPLAARWMSPMPSTPPCIWQRPWCHALLGAGAPRCPGRAAALGVWSRGVVVQLTIMLRGRRYGPASPRQRPHDGGGPSGDPAIPREGESAGQALWRQPDHLIFPRFRGHEVSSPSVRPAQA